MSYWTYLTAAIDITIYDVYQQDLEFVKEMLQLAPKITGSEHDADVVAVPLSAYNPSETCELCPFRNNRRYTKGSRRDIFYCDHPPEYNCWERKYKRQAHYVIVVAGSFRDRFKEQTLKEFNAFKRWITCRENGLRWDINTVACSIKGSYTWECFPRKGSFKKLSERNWDV